MSDDGHYYTYEEYVNAKVPKEAMVLPFICKHEYVLKKDIGGLVYMECRKCRRVVLPEQIE